MAISFQLMMDLLPCLTTLFRPARKARKSRFFVFVFHLYGYRMTHMEEKKYRRYRIFMSGKLPFFIGETLQGHSPRNALEKRTPSLVDGLPKHEWRLWRLEYEFNYSRQSRGLITSSQLIDFALSPALVPIPDSLTAWAQEP